MTDLLTAIDVATTEMTNQIAATDQSKLGEATPCSEWDVKALVEHAKGTCDFFTGAVGGTPAEGDVWEGDAAANFSKSGTAALTAMRDRGLEGTVDLGGNEMPATMAAGILAMDVYVHAWDLATAAGNDISLDDDVCATLLEVTSPAIDGFRPNGFGPAVEVADQVPASARLLAFSGRAVRQP